VDEVSVRYRTIYDVVREIPVGRVATYGQIAAIVGCGARQVGYAMATLPLGSDVPWHRVINAKGRVSPRASGSGATAQRTMLEAEGMEFDDSDGIDLDRHGWDGPHWPWMHDRGLHPIPLVSTNRRHRGER